MMQCQLSMQVIFLFCAVLCPVVLAEMPPHHHHHPPPPIDPMDHHDHMNMGNDSMGMEMYFRFRVKEYILFKGWRTTTVGGMVVSVIGVFLMGILYEGLKFFREYMFKKFVSKIQFSTVAIAGENGKANQVHKVEKYSMLSWSHALQTSLHLVQMTLSYFLMLIFMTYNGWLCMGVVAGAGAGYFVFGWRRSSLVDITDHCH